MTAAFSWMMVARDRQVRLILAHDVLIRMDREWDDQWRVESADLHASVDGAHTIALRWTGELEQRGFALDGGVITSTTDTKPYALYDENKASWGRKPPGPLLQELFRLGWEQI